MKLRLSKEFVLKCLTLGLPVMVQNLTSFGGTNLVVAIIGTISDNAISAYTIANESYSIYYMIALGLNGGFLVFISQLFASKNLYKCNQLLRLGTKVILGVGFVFSFCMSILSKQFVGLFTNDLEMIELSASFLRLYSWSMMIYGVNALWSDLYIYTGKAKNAFYSSLTYIATTLIFSIVLSKGLFGLPSLGLKSVAIAMLIGRIFENIFLLILLNKKDSNFKLIDKYPNLEMSELLKILKVSIPLISNEAIYSIAFLFIVKNLTYLGGNQIACYTIVNNCKSLFFVVNYAMNPAIIEMAGRNLSLGKYDEAKENTDKVLLLIFYIHIIFALLLYVLSPFIPGWFSISGQTASICTKMLRFETFEGLFVLISNSLYNILKIGGDAKRVFAMDGLFSLACPMVLTFICAYWFKTSFYVCWLAMESTYVLKTALGMFFYIKGTWIKRLY